MLSHPKAVACGMRWVAVVVLAVYVVPYQTMLSQAVICQMLSWSPFSSR